MEFLAIIFGFGTIMLPFWWMIYSHELLDVLSFNTGEGITGLLLGLYIWGCHLNIALIIYFIWDTK